MSERFWDRRFCDEPCASISTERHRRIFVLHIRQWQIVSIDDNSKHAHYCTSMWSENGLDGTDAEYHMTAVVRYHTMSMTREDWLAALDDVVVAKWRHDDRRFRWRRYRRWRPTRPENRVLIPASRRCLDDKSNWFFADLQHCIYRAHNKK